MFQPPAEHPLFSIRNLFILCSAFIISCKQPLRKFTGFSEKAVAAGNLPDGKQMPVHTPDTRPAIYLSFDDGPNKGTRTVVNILQQEKAPASFFLIGTHAIATETQHALWEELQRSANTLLCNHSYTHGFHNKYELYYNHPDSVVKDFKKNMDSLRLNNRIARTPSSNIWRLPRVHADYYARRKNAADSLARAGFQLVGWDWEWRYNNKMELRQNADRLYAEVDSLFRIRQTKISNHLVLLAHDHTFSDAKDSASLHQFIQKIKTEGKYRFALLDTYPGLEGE